MANSGGRYTRDTYCCVYGSTSANYPSAWYAFDAGNARFYVLQAAWADTNVGPAAVPTPSTPPTSGRRAPPSTSG